MKIYAQNGGVEFGEKVLRGGVGVIMIETVLLTPAMSPALIAGFALVALYLVFTAIIGWDPLYALAKGSQPHGEQINVAASSHVATSRVSVARDYKKAA